MNMRKLPIYPLAMTNIAMENCQFIDDFPIKTFIYQRFSMAMLNNQRGYVYIYIYIYTREALLSEAGFEKVSGPRIGSVGASKLASYHFVSSGGLIVCC